MNRRSFLKGMGVAALTVAFPVSAVPMQPAAWFEDAKPIDHPAELVPMKMDWADGGLLNPEQCNAFIRRLIQEPTMLRQDVKITMTRSDHVFVRDWSDCDRDFDRAFFVGDDE